VAAAACKGNVRYTSRARGITTKWRTLEQQGGRRAGKEGGWEGEKERKGERGSKGQRARVEREGRATGEGEGRGTEEG